MPQTKTSTTAIGSETMYGYAKAFAELLGLAVANCNIGRRILFQDLSDLDSELTEAVEKLWRSWDECEGAPSHFDQRRR